MERGWKNAPGVEARGARIVHGAACYDKAGRSAEVINRAAVRCRAVFGRVTPTRAHRSDPARLDPSNSRLPRKSIPRRVQFSWRSRERRRLDDARPTDPSADVVNIINHGHPPTSSATSEPARGAARLRDAEEAAEQVRTQTPPGDQKTVDEEPGGEEVAELDLLALGHTGHRGDLALVVPAVAGREKHRHVHHLRGRELGGLHLDLLLLRRVRGEPEEREHRERDDHVTRALRVHRSETPV